MSYIVEFNATFTRNLPELTFITFNDWLDTVSYADIAEFFPEISVADWPAIKAGILEVYNKTRPVVGQTPGVVDFTETKRTNGTQLVLTFSDSLNYNIYYNYCQDNKQYGLTPGFAFEAPETAVDNFITMNGRIINFVSSGLVKTDPEIGYWLAAKYNVTYGLTKSCVHTQT
jgi:hypothetical protein